MVLFPERFEKELIWYRKFNEEEKRIYKNELWRFFFDKDDLPKYNWNKLQWDHMIESLAKEAKCNKEIIVKQIMEKIKNHNF